MVSFTTPYFASSGRLHKVLSVAKTGFRPVVSVSSAFTPSRAGAVSQNVPVMAQNGTSVSPKCRVDGTFAGAVPKLKVPKCHRMAHGAQMFGLYSGGGEAVLATSPSSVT